MSRPKSAVVKDIDIADVLGKNMDIVSIWAMAIGDIDPPLIILPLFM